MKWLINSKKKTFSKKLPNYNALDSQGPKGNRRQGLSNLIIAPSAQAATI